MTSPHSLVRVTNKNTNKQTYEHIYGFGAQLTDRKELNTSQPHLSSSEEERERWRNRGTETLSRAQLNTALTARRHEVNWRDELYQLTVWLPLLVMSSTQT